MTEQSDDIVVEDMIGDDNGQEQISNSELEEKIRRMKEKIRGFQQRADSN
jgi:cell division septum initiation protein DivIVA